MLLNFAGSGHPILRCASALERGELRSKGGGKTSLHFNGSTENIELPSVLFDEAFMDSILPTPPAPHHCVDLDPFRTLGPTSVDFSNRLALSDPGK